MVCRVKNSGRKYRAVWYGVWISFFFMAGMYPAVISGSTSPPEAQKPLYNGFLYFADSGYGHLKSVQQAFAAGLEDHELGRALLQALINGPAVSGLEPVLPGITVIRSFFITGDAVAYVDLEVPEDITAQMDIQSELLAVYAVVNSLTVNIPGIEKVRILLGGKPARTLAGHIDLDCFYETNMLIVK